MGNTFSVAPESQETTSTSLRTYKSLPEKLKRLAQGNITALLAKKGWKLPPRFHLRLLLPNSQMTLQALLGFMHRHRTRMASLKRLSVFLDVKEIIPLLMTTVSVRPLVRKLGQKISRLRNIESAEIGSSQINAFGIEETLIESLAKMKKITSLSLEIPDNQNKINVIAKKLASLKRITKLKLDFAVRNANIKPILNRIKLSSRLEMLKIDLSDCSFPPDLLYKLAEVLKKMKKLEYFHINLQNTTVKDDEVKVLYDTVEALPRMEQFRFDVEGCTELSWLLRAKLYAKKTLGTGDHC